MKWRHLVWRGRLRRFWSLLLVALLAMGGLRAVAAEPITPSLPAAAPVSGAVLLPDAGSFQLAKVRILGVPAITVATSSLSASGSGPDAARRAHVIEGNLKLLYEPRLVCSIGESLAEHLRDSGPLRGGEKACDETQLGLLGPPDSLQVVPVERPGLPIVLVAQVPGRQEPLPLLTVTADDARINGTTPQRLAQRWRDLLERRLRYARRLMQPASLRQRLQAILLSELLLALLVWFSLLLWRRSRRTTIALEQRFGLRCQNRRQTLAVNGAQALSRGLLLLAVVLLIAMAGVALFALPGELPLALDLLLQPGGVVLKLVLVWTVAAGARALVWALLSQWAENVKVPPDRRARRDQRYHSLLKVLRRLVDLVAVLIAGFWILSGLPGIVRLSGSALLASGALLGALAIVFQGLLRDFVAGLVVIFDDRYAIDDVVEINGLTGTVMDVGLLSTELRCLDQRVVVIQNSSCEQVVNHTKLRSGVDVQLVLSPGLRDLARALAVIGEEVQAFAADPAWSSQLLEPPMLRGVEQVSPDGITVSVLLVTTAGAQWSVQRALLGRLVQRLKRQAIPLANRERQGSRSIETA